MLMEGCLLTAWSPPAPSPAGLCQALGLLLGQGLVEGGEFSTLAHGLFPSFVSHGSSPDSLWPDPLRGRSLILSQTCSPFRSIAPSAAGVLFATCGYSVTAYSISCSLYPLPASAGGWLTPLLVGVGEEYNQALSLAGMAFENSELPCCCSLAAPFSGKALPASLSPGPSTSLSPAEASHFCLVP